MATTQKQKSRNSGGRAASANHGYDVAVAGVQVIAEVKKQRAAKHRYHERCEQFRARNAGPLNRANREFRSFTKEQFEA